MESFTGVPLDALRPVTKILKRVFVYCRSIAWGFHIFRGKKKSLYSYSILTVTRNSELYLDAYFASLVRQHVDFKKYIKVVVVDDGSTDRTGEVLEKWRRRYPDNVTTMTPSGQGMGAGRNQAMVHAAAPWITFIAADDFVAADYFEKVGVYLQSRGDESLAAIFCRRKSSYEKNGKLRDDDPLNFLFKRKRLSQSIENLDFVPPVVSGAFFPLSAIRRSGISFDEACVSGIADMDFILRYLSRANGQVVAFVPEAVYYVSRGAGPQRAVHPSEPGRNDYISALKKIGGFLLESGEKSGGVPAYVQNLVLGELLLRLKSVFARRNDVFLPTASSVLDFWLQCEELFSRIDVSVIDEFFRHVQAAGEEYRVGVLGTFKGKKLSGARAFIEAYDPVKNMIRFRYPTGLEQPESEMVMVDGQVSPLLFAKTVARQIGDRVFYRERLFWAGLPRNWENLSLSIGGCEVLLTCGKSTGRVFRPSDLISVLSAKRPTGDAWLLMDSDMRADDNAEHLYRHIKAEHPEREIFFALRKCSPDWRRLSAEGFKLLDFGSRRFLKEAGRVGKVISSHADRYIVAHRKNFLQGKHFVFLQHGVIKDDLSRWINKLPIDLMVTSTKAEYDSIAGDGSPYALSPREVVLTGLPRHDSLLRPTVTKGNEPRRILVMPTWRSYLVGPKKEAGQSYLPCADFFSSLYARSWQGLLASEKLRGLAIQYRFTVRFQPHPNMRAYFRDKNVFGVHVEISLSDSGDIQSAFKDAAVLITDYSSVAFDMAFLQKPVLYYQFDEQEMFSGTHTYTPGYFAYRRDGFGPVSETADTLLAHLEEMLQRGVEPVEPYLTRMRSAFRFRDGHACERVYEAIMELDAPLVGKNVPLVADSAPCN